MQPRYALHRQCIGVHCLYDIRSLVSGYIGNEDVRHGHFLKSRRYIRTPYLEPLYWVWGRGISHTAHGGLVYVSRKPEVSGISRVLTRMKGTPISKIRKREEINRKGILGEGKWTPHVWDLESPNVSQSSI